MSTSVFVAGIVLIWGNFARLLIYFKNSVVELKKVVWPDKAYATKMTIFVLIFVTILTIFIIWLIFNFLGIWFDLLMEEGLVMSKKWYVVQAYSGFEKMYKRHLRIELKERGWVHLWENISTNRRRLWISKWEAHSK